MNTHTLVRFLQEELEEVKQAKTFVKKARKSHRLFRQEKLQVMQHRIEDALSNLSEYASIRKALH